MGAAGGSKMGRNDRPNRFLDTDRCCSQSLESIASKELEAANRANHLGQVRKALETGVASNRHQ